MSRRSKFGGCSFRNEHDEDIALSGVRADGFVTIRRAGSTSPAEMILTDVEVDRLQKLLSLLYHDAPSPHVR